MDASQTPVPISGIFRFRGPDARRFCNGMFTNNVRDLPVLGGQRTAMCDAKGKLLGLGDLYAVADDTVLLLVEGWDREAFLAHYGKYIVLDDVELDDDSDRLSVITVQGADAERELAARGLSIPGPVYVATGPEGQPVVGFSWAEANGVGVARRDRCGRGGFDVVVPKGMALNLPASNPETLESDRVALGEVRWPNDMPARFLLHELGLRDRVCSFEKGCYIGQEVVHRIDVMGQVRRGLAGVRVAGDAPDGAEILSDGAVVGRLTSTVTHPRWGRIGLAVLRKPNDTPGTPVAVRWDGGQADGVVSALPFA
jgi:folate-binding protein YgfZ